MRGVYDPRAFLPIKGMLVVEEIVQAQPNMRRSLKSAVILVSSNYVSPRTYHLRQWDRVLENRVSNCKIQQIHGSLVISFAGNSDPSLCVRQFQSTNLLLNPKKSYKVYFLPQSRRVDQPRRAHELQSYLQNRVT